MPEDKTKPGPEAEVLKLPGDWKKRLAEAVQKKKPEAGWPKPEKPQEAPGEN